ncbi:MAG: phosphatidate cytidylyltransferase [Beijerinckiaceae bacterium]
MWRAAADGSGAFGDLGPRLVSSILLAAVALATLWAGGIAFALFWLSAGLAIEWEWQALIGGVGARWRFLSGAVGVTFAAAFASHLALGFAGAVLIGAAALTAILASEDNRGWAGLGVLYAGALVVSVIALRQSDALGLGAIAWLFAIVWGSDAMAYFGGRLIGGAKLWPRVSAGKTWSGTLVGIVGGALLGLAVALFQAEHIAIFPLLLLGLLLAVVSQAGDLCESALKRRFGVKDSGTLIPGHGGVMDRLDGFAAACVCAALIGGLRLYPFIAAGVLSW